MLELIKGGFIVRQPVESNILLQKLFEGFTHLCQIRYEHSNLTGWTYVGKYEEKKLLLAQENQIWC